jgi:hypothetical protein
VICAYSWSVSVSQVVREIAVPEEAPVVKTPLGFL